MSNAPRVLNDQGIAGVPGWLLAGNETTGRLVYARQKDTPEFKCWVEMRRRCRAKHRKGCDPWTSRGVSVCERWETFANFAADMGPISAIGYTVDRIDGTKNYEPGNCRWATKAEQNRNRPSFNKMFTIGSVTKCLAEWIRDYGASRSVTLRHLARGLSIEDALTKPSEKNKPYTAFGESKTITEWSKSSGIGYITLHARVHRMGLSMEEALSLPLVRGRRIAKK